MIEVMKNIKDIKSYFSTRNNGVSQTPFESLNVGFHVGDDDINVLENHKYIKSFFNENSKISYMNQIHSNKVCNIGELNEIAQCDALITDKKDKILMVMVADCIPILFFDKKKKVIAAIHAGRAGAFKNIIGQTLSLMKKRYKSSIEDLVVSIGPHIQHCCYEVGREIVDEAIALDLECFIKEKNKSFHLDLLSLVLYQLHNIGVDRENIEIVNECTACNTDKYFSYRKEGKTGRFCGVIMLE